MKPPRGMTIKEQGVKDGRLIVSVSVTRWYLRKLRLRRWWLR